MVSLQNFVPFSPVIRSEPSDTAIYTFELSVGEDAPRALASFVSMKHGKYLALPWPPNWCFTYWDFSRDPAHQPLGERLLRELYVCCSEYIFEIGVVHDSSLDPGRAHPVILLGEGGRVYLYDGRNDVLSLVSQRGFVDFHQKGLIDCNPIREAMQEACYVSRDPIAKRLLKAQTLSEIAVERDTLTGREIGLLERQNISVMVANAAMAGYAPDDMDMFKRHACTDRLEVLLCVRVTSQEELTEVVIFIDGEGRIFGVDVNDSKIQYLAKDLYTFFRIGTLRFKNCYDYRKGCYSSESLHRAHHSGEGRAFRPTGCSRGVFCRRVEEKHTGSLKRCYSRLKKACQRRRK
uniref:Tegument protein UL43 n=1 Tax=Cardioderma bat herpesvirus TaxID=3141914 RepID=A0AAU7E0U5_9VIRU